MPPDTDLSGYYSTIAIADSAITFFKEHATNSPEKPFFAYLAFTGPHMPMQALPQDIAKYRDRYLVGWDVIRAARFKRQTEMGIVHTTLSPLEPTIGPRVESDFSEKIDQEIGRIIAQLKAMNVYENTLI